jgi:DNA-binding response OmpR family regulator
MNKKILIVEDDTDILQLLKALLTSAGYQVKGTLTCSEGLELFYSFQPDLVLLDINVGNEDGRQVCIEIRSQANYQHIPVVMISANEHDLQNYREYGANDFLKKPFTLSTLKSTCLKHLGLTA